VPWSAISWRAAAPGTVIDSGMEETAFNAGRLGATSKSFARRLLTIGENRLELLTVEVQEERERLLYAFLLALGVSAFGLLAGLMLAAHTHGGQIWPLGYLVKLRYPLFAGRYDVNGIPVLVTRGAGTWGPRMRLWAPGEILRITLRASRGGVL